MIWWQYLMLVNIYLLVFYGFYALLLSKETFFQLNRIYLVAAALLSFLIPVIQSSWVQSLFITRQVQLTIYNSPLVVYQFKPIEHTHVTIGQVLAMVYLMGMVLLSAKLALQLFKLSRLLKNPEPDAAYSFFKTVKLASSQRNNQVIAAHEQVHAKQWHSADVLLIEAVMIINWFNPIVYLYRFSIKHIHEFIADRQALQAGTDKSDYAMLLLTQTFNVPPNGLVNPFFNHSLLKQRIMMLHKNKSQRIALAKYCLSAPLFILMLILSSATVNNSRTIKLINKKAELVFTAPAAATVKDLSFGLTIDTAITKKKSAKAATKDITITLDAPVKIDTVPGKDGPVFTQVEQVPEFPGGMTAFGKFLGSTIKYPAKAREAGVQGRVLVSFIVEEDGALSNLHVVRGVESDLDAEALRAMNLSPKWKPGVQNGRTVRVAYTVPIAFTLDGKKPPVYTGNPTGAVKESKPVLILEPSPGEKMKSDTARRTELTLSIDPPLYILDGKEISSLKAVDPNTIESINVLKDKSATALYGTKAENGVVIITSKKPTLKLMPVKPAVKKDN